jgi:hypothetical protein
MRLFFNDFLSRAAGDVYLRPPDPRGTPLPADKLSSWEERFRCSFSDVRLFHTPELAGVGLAACASGNAIYHAAGAPGPLLEHELGHLVQQRRAGCRVATNSAAILIEDPALESDPDARPDILRDLAAAGYQVAQPIKMRYAWCNYAHLLSAMDEAVDALGGGADPYAGQDRLTRKVRFRMRSGAHWVYLANQKSLKAPGRLPCTVQVINGAPVECGVGGTAGGERVYFPGGRDLNYRDVAEGVRAVMTGGDAAWAQLMLDRVTGADTNAGSDMAWVDALIVLMFGMETARFHSGLCTTVLFMDLIANGKAYGRTGKPFGFSDAFHTGSWEDGEWYGGKYPYATHGTGSGNNYMRTVLASDYQMVLMEHYAGLPQRHAVPRREVSLCVHWLESALGPDPDLYDDELYNKVLAALTNRLRDFYLRNQPRANLRYSPNPTSGVSAFGGAKGNKAPLPGRNAQVYWHDVPYSSRNCARYYHATADPLCGSRTGVSKGPRLIQQEKDNFKRTLVNQGKPPDVAQNIAFSRPDWNAVREQSMSPGGWQACPRWVAERYDYQPCPKCFNV